MVRVVACRVKSYRFSLTSIEISATLNLKCAYRKLFGCQHTQVEIKITYDVVFGTITGLIKHILGQNLPSMRRAGAVSFFLLFVSMDISFHGEAKQSFFLGLKDIYLVIPSHHC